jgi:hypothetical protein
MTQTFRLRQTDSEFEELEWLAAFCTVLLPYTAILSHQNNSYSLMLFSLILHNSSEGLQDLIRKERHG